LDSSISKLFFINQTMNRLSVFGFVVAGARTLNNCGSDTDHFKVSTMNVDADDMGGIKKGKGFTVDVEGEFDENFVNGTLYLDLSSKVGVMPAIPIQFSEKFEFHPGFPADGPGPVKVSVGPIVVPRTVPGKITTQGRISLVNDKLEPVLCLDLDMVIPAILEDEEQHKLGVEAGRLNCGDATNDHINNIVFNIDDDNVATTTAIVDKEFNQINTNVDIKMRIAPFPEISVSAMEIKTTFSPAFPAGPIKIVGRPSDQNPSDKLDNAPVVELLGALQFVDQDEEELFCIGFGKDANALSV